MALPKKNNLARDVITFLLQNGIVMIDSSENPEWLGLSGKEKVVPLALWSKVKEVSDFLTKPEAMTFYSLVATPGLVFVDGQELLGLKLKSLIDNKEFLFKVNL
jgi:hypothetical protein